MTRRSRREWFRETRLLTALLSLVVISAALLVLVFFGYQDAGTATYRVLIRDLCYALIIGTAAYSITQNAYKKLVDRILSRIEIDSGMDIRLHGPTESAPEEIRACRSNVDILQISLSNRFDIARAIKRLVVEHRVRVRILLYDPSAANHFLLEDRNKLLTREKAKPEVLSQHIVESCQEILDAVREAKQEHNSVPGCVQIRFYRERPCFVAYRYDAKLVVGFPLADRYSSESPSITIFNFLESHEWSTLFEYFERIWNDDRRSYDSEEVMKGMKSTTT